MMQKQKMMKHGICYNYRGEQNTTMKIYYHATDYNNMASILGNGLIANTYENLVYLTEKEEDAIKFVALRGYAKAVTLKVKIYKSDEHNIIETFDHNEAIFKCRAFGHRGSIPSKQITPSKVYDLSGLTGRIH